MAQKLTKRKAFKFYRSYYDVYNELSNNDKLKFIEAILDRQFLGIKPNNLNGMARFAYLSQEHSIDLQVKGYEDATKSSLCTENQDVILENKDPYKGGYEGPTIDPPMQEKEKEKEKEEYTIDFLYKLYPTNCPFKNKSLGKCDKDKKKIEQLLKVYTSKEIEERIQFYIKDCNTSRTWYKNFGTLLNNLPDITEIPVVVRNKPRKPTF